MSTYYNYYLGYRNNKDGKLYPLAPYDASGKLCSIHEENDTYGSEIRDEFFDIKESEVSDKLREDLIKDTDLYLFKVLDLADLPTGESPLVTKYFLIDEIAQYEKGDMGFCPEFVFTESMEIKEYNLRFSNSQLFNDTKFRCDGTEDKDLKNYALYSYINYWGKEYFSMKMNNFADCFKLSKLLHDNDELVILLYIS